MFRLTFSAMVVVFACLTALAQQPPAANDEQLIGAWNGRWEMGDTNGGFDLTIERGPDKALTGRVSVTGEPSYNATLKKLTFDGKKFEAAYDFTPEPAGEVILSATLEGNIIKGTWSLRAKADGNQFATGAWTVTRK
jgi:hypothetical protein